MPFIFMDHGRPAPITYPAKPKILVTTLNKTGITKEVDPHEHSGIQQGGQQGGANPYEATQIENRKVSKAVDIMSQPVFSMELDQLTIKSAWQFMLKHKIKHLPVTQDQKLVGITTELDVLRFNVKHFNINPNPEDAWIVKKVYAATLDTDIHQLAHVMFDKHISTLPIVDDSHHVLGMVTRSDILRVTSHYGPMEFWA